jgi:hypothetical protein
MSDPDYHADRDTVFARYNRGLANVLATRSNSLSPRWKKEKAIYWYQEQSGGSRFGELAPRGYTMQIPTA